MALNLDKDLKKTAYGSECWSSCSLCVIGKWRRGAIRIPVQSCSPRCGLEWLLTHSGN